MRPRPARERRSGSRSSSRWRWAGRSPSRAPRSSSPPSTSSGSPRRPSALDGARSSARAAAPRRRRARPVGPCLIVTPWNFPLAVPARGVGRRSPPDARSCSGPRSLAPPALGARPGVLVEAGLPDGVLNVVVSSEDGATDALLADPRLRKLDVHRLGARSAATCSGPFAAENSCGRRSSSAAARPSSCSPTPTSTPRSRAPCGEDAKRRRGVHGREPVLRGSAASPGIHPALAERWPRSAWAAAPSRATALGPMIAARQRRGASPAWWRTRSPAGANSSSAAARSRAAGTSSRPSCSPTCRTTPAHARGDLGPVAPVHAFDGEDEAVALANDSSQGLAAYSSTGDLGRALRARRRHQGRDAAVNRGRRLQRRAPFGGVGHSGVGRSGGREGIDEYPEHPLPDDALVTGPRRRPLAPAAAACVARRLRCPMAQASGPPRKRQVSGRWTGRVAGTVRGGWRGEARPVRPAAVRRVPGHHRRPGRPRGARVAPSATRFAYRHDRIRRSGRGADDRERDARGLTGTLEAAVDHARRPPVRGRCIPRRTASGRQLLGLIGPSHPFSELADRPPRPAASRFGWRRLAHVFGGPELSGDRRPDSPPRPAEAYRGVGVHAGIGRQTHDDRGP